MNAGRFLLLGGFLIGTVATSAVAHADMTPPPAEAADAGVCDPDAGPCAPMTVEQLFKAKCATCHGADAKGKTKYGIKHKIPNFTTKRWQTTIEDKEIAEKIRGGVTDKGKRVMPAFNAKLTPDQVVALTVYLRALKP